MGAAVDGQAFFAILRWRRDVARDEARNVAVILVDGEGPRGIVRHAPLSRISPRLHDQGLMDTFLVGLQKQFSSGTEPALATLQHLRDSFHRSLYFTEPTPAALPADMETVATGLYRAYVAPRVVGTQKITKGKLLDNVVESLRRRGFEVGRGRYLGDFLFDVIIEGPGQSSVMEVLSFATGATDWTPVEHDAGYFLYALRRVERTGLAVVQRPTEAASDTARDSYERVSRLLKNAEVDEVEPDQLADCQLALPV